jgi:hypothetical protein
VVGIVALLANVLVTDFDAPDYMPIYTSDDPFIGTCAACVLPLLVGVTGMILGRARCAGVSTTKPPIHLD